MIVTVTYRYQHGGNEYRSWRKLITVDNNYSGLAWEQKNVSLCLAPGFVSGSWFMLVSGRQLMVALFENPAA